ncbi:MAG: aldehyde dehydrogenase, partial [Planctomycetales bacterium]|nr:aldehyde dehydrogenase [Planctomycetales bacterium]
MLNIPVIRWGKPYESLEIDEVKHFATGEPIAKVSQANGGIISRDMRTASKARDILRQMPCSEIIERLKKAADLYESEALPIGDGTQTPEEFAHQQSASTGLPEHM